MEQQETWKEILTNFVVLYRISQETTQNTNNSNGVFLHIQLLTNKKS